MNRRLITTIGLLAMAVAYMAAFAVWWAQSPRYTRLVAGTEVQYLEFHYNSFSWHTRAAWLPALWLATKIGGYHEVGVAAAYERSMILYAR